MIFTNIPAIFNQKCVINQAGNKLKRCTNSSKSYGTFTFGTVAMANVSEYSSLKEILKTRLAKIRIKNPKKTIDNATDVLDNGNVNSAQNTQVSQNKEKSVGVNYYA